MKPTKATLKKYVRRGQLFHVVTQEFDGMIDGKTKGKTERLTRTTLKDIDYFFMSRNFLTAQDNGDIKLSNCCFNITFKIK